LALKNEINHVVLVIDASGSMGYHQNTVIKVVDDTIEHLARRSTEMEQETRVTIYTFSSGYQAVKCIAYDMDVLRLPSMKGIYRPSGGTALIDATIKAIDDLSQTATLYGDHAFLMYVITDGEENSSSFGSTALTAKLKALDVKGNWSYAAFVPSQTGVNQAVKYGFPKDNVIVWDVASASGFETVGNIVRQASDSYMTARSTGVKSVKSLFRLNTVSTSDIKRNLTPLSQMQYNLLYVPVDQRVDEFTYDRTGSKLIVGKAYYQLTKKETIQANKNIAISFNNHIYSGPQARTLLGLPDYTVDVDPKSDSYTGYTIFVQSTALNRKLIGGTNLLLLK
jgi:von Willebrand factor type A domain